MMTFGYGKISGTSCDRCQARIQDGQPFLLVTLNATNFALCGPCGVGTACMGEAEFLAHIASGTPKVSPALKALRAAAAALYASAGRHRVAGDTAAADECDRQAYSAHLAAGYLEQQEWNAADLKGTG